MREPMRDPTRKEADETTFDDGDEDCAAVVRRLYHFLDGELTEERRTAIRRHLDECGPCIDAFDFEAELRQVVASRCRERVPDSLRDRVAAAIRAETSLAGSLGHGASPAGPAGLGSNGYAK